MTKVHFPERSVSILEFGAVEGDSTRLADEDFTDGAIDILAVLIKTGITKSRGEGRRLVEQGGVSADDEKITDISVTYDADDFAGEGKLVKRGKKNFIKVVR